MKRNHSVDALFALLLYGLFALLSLLLVLIGAQVYRGIVRRTDARSDLRASLSDVANKVRSAPEANLENRDGLTVLVLPEQSGEQTFETLIYFYDGTLREMFQMQGDAFTPSYGEELAALAAFSIEESADGLLTVISRGADGQDHTLHIQKRAG